MIREYTETHYYALVKVQAPEGTNPLDAMEIAREIENEFQKFFDGGDLFIEGGLTYSFESDHSCEQGDAVRYNAFMHSYLARILPEGWKVIK